MPKAALRIIVTAGPTHEPIDPVRYLANRSSGLTGYALAAEAAKRGHVVTLISGPVNLPPVEGAALILIETAAEMRDQVVGRFDDADVVIMAAAVADYRPANPSELKLKKTETDPVLHLLRNPDILRELGELKTSQTLVGFALETHDQHAAARRKFEEKKLDLLVLNGPANLGSNEGAHQVLSSEGFGEREVRSKGDFAKELIDQVECLNKGEN